MAWEGNGKEIMTSVGIARTWEGKEILFLWGKVMGSKINKNGWYGKEKGREKGLKCPKMLQNWDKIFINMSKLLK